MDRSASDGDVGLYADFDNRYLRHDGGGNEPDRQCVAKCHRRERDQYDPATVPMQTERHGEEPPHPRIEAVECAESGEGQPRPCGGHRRPVHDVALPADCTTLRYSADAYWTPRSE